MTFPLLVIAALCALYIGPLLLSQRSSRREARELLENGHLAEAEILGYAAGKGGLWVEYEFTPNPHETERRTTHTGIASSDSSCQVRRADVFF